ncbi:1676_t:CDS:2, partial [Acaulospora colombiana]
MTNGDASNLPTRFQRQVITVAPPNSVIVQSEKKQAFSYDYVFGPESSQQEVYEKAIVKLVDKFLEGYNVTVLAYGQTSSGKTHTMGTADNSSVPFESKGIIPRAMTTLFDQTNGPKYRSNKFSIKVSFIEIYNEELIDLLGDGDTRSQVTIREDSKGNIIWNGLQEIKVNGVEELMGHLSRGSLNRQVGATQMNAQSSRSHAIFSVTMTHQKYVAPSNPTTGAGTPSPPPSKMIRPVSSMNRLNKQFDEGAGELVTVTSKYHFVDLAGSEREGISINSGLLALGNVISALGDPNKAKHTTHIPYRDSKLTRLLQDSLGGNAQTLMIACVSPAEFNLNETVNTLKYANRARNIKNNASVNQEEAGWHDLEHVQSLVVKLRNEIKLLKSGGALGLTASNGSTSCRNSMCESSSSGRSTPTQLTNSSSIEHSSPLLAPTNANGTTPHSLLKKPSIHLSATMDHGDENDPDQQLDQLVTMPHLESQSKTSKSSTSQQEEPTIVIQPPSFEKVVEPVIEEYEKSISVLESQLALNRAALAHADSIMSNQESRLEYAEQLNSDNLRLIDELKMKITELSDKDMMFVQHIKVLESKLEAYEEEQKRDQEIIKELRECVEQLKEEEKGLRSSEEHHRRQEEVKDDRIKTLENQLDESDRRIVEFSRRIEKLEIRLKERSDLFLELEAKLTGGDGIDGEKEKKFLLGEILERENRIALLEENVNELTLGLDELKRSKMHEDELLRMKDDGKGGVTEDLQKKLSELQQTHEKTVAEYSQIKTKYQECLSELQDIKTQLSQSKLNEARLMMNNHYNDPPDDSPSTPITPVSPSSTLINSTPRFSSSAATIISARSSLPEFDEITKDGNEYSLLRQKIHRKTQSLSGELKRRGSECAKVEEEDVHYSDILDSTQRSVETLEMKLAALQQELSGRNELSSNSSTSDTSSDGVSDIENGQNDQDNDTTNDKESLRQELKIQLELLKDLKLKYERYELLMKDLTDQENLRKKIEEKEAEAEVYKKQLVEIKNQRDEMQAQIDDLQAQLTSKSNSEADLQSQELKDTRMELERIKRHEQSGLEKIQTLAEREAELMQELERSRAVESEYKEKIHSLESKILAQSDTSADGNVQPQEDLTSLRRELALAKESSDTYKHKIGDLEMKLEKSNLEYQSLRNKVNLLKSRVKCQRSEMEFQEFKHAETQQQIFINKELECLRSLDNYIQQQHESKISDLEEEVRSLQKQKADADINFTTLTYKLNNEIKELESKISESQKESDRLKSEIKLLHDLELDQKAIIKQLQSKLNESTNSNHILEIELSGLRKSAEEQKEYVELLKEELRSVRSNGNTEGLTNLLSNTMRERDEDRQKIQDLSLELLSIREKMRNAEFVKNTEANLENNDLKKKCAQLEGLVEEAKKEFLEISNRNSESVRMAEQLSIQLEKVQSEAESNYKRVESLEEINQQLRSEKELQLAANEEFSNQIKSLKADLENLTLEYTETAKKYEAADLITSEQQLRINELERDLEETNGLNETISALSDELTTVNSKLEGLKAANKNLQQINEDLKAKVNVAEEKSDSLSQEIEKLKSELDNLQVANDSSIEELKGKITVLESEKVDLIEEKKKLEKRLLEEQSRRRRPSFGINPPDLSSEVQKLNRKITKIEGDNAAKNILIDSLESELTKSEKIIDASSKEIETLKKENIELIDQINYLRSRLDETTVEFEHEKSNVYEEKKVIENVLEEERKAKLELENRMEELMAKK